MQRQISVIQIKDVIDRLEEHDAIIDVRSPTEFHGDHILGASNLFVLNDQERVTVGTIYKEVDSFTARKLGGSLTSKNIAAHITNLLDKPKTWNPLIYCWRGGQRSRSMALVMSEIGWSVSLLQGGYKSFRRYIQIELDNLVNQFHWLVLTGPTGAGKTRHLLEMQERGIQILNLEGIALHRGSILGQEPGCLQPTQKFFETNLFFAISKLDPNRPVWIESESSKIGDLHIPKTLFTKIGKAQAILLSCSLEQRAEFLLHDYAHLTTNAIKTQMLVSKLAFRQAKSRINKWSELIDKGSWKELTSELLQYHYDPAYAQSQQRLNIIRVIKLQNPSVLPDAIIDIDKLYTNKIMSL